MKTRKNLLLILATIVVALIASSCSAEQPNVAKQEVYINSKDFQYSNYDFWEKENELRLLVHKQSNMEEINIREQPVGILGLVESSEEQEQLIEEMRQGIVQYFLTVHNIDISNELEAQKVMFYKTVKTDEELGYINPNEANIIMLNAATMQDGEQSGMFNDTYIRLSLEQIGFESETAKALTEGFINALTERILSFMSKSLIFRETYTDATNIAHQLIEADPQIVKCYLGNEPIDIVEKINKKLEKVPRVYLEEANPAGRLETILTIMNGLWENENIVFSGEPHSLLFEAQEIARAYCKQCKPSKKTIDYIRTKYIIVGFEDLEIIIDPDEGNRLSNR